MSKAPTLAITVSCAFLLCSAHLVPGAEQQKTTRDLIQYIQEAKKLGLKDGKIRDNAVKAGWDKSMLDEAFAVVRYLDTEPAGVATPNATAGEKGNGGVPAPEGYRIGSGDVLQIVVWKEPDASVPTTVVRADGKITMPLIKEVEAAGLTPAELEKVLTEKLSSFIRGADVTVVAKEINSLKAYLVGAVKKEGPVQLRAQMTVLKAINEAGGLTDYAKRRKIYILRSENGKEIRLPFDYQAVIKGENMRQNIVLRPDDTIVVPQ